jgi:hypothetical protein
MSKDLIPRENLKLQFDPEWEKAARAGADPNVVWAFDEMEKVVVASDGRRLFYSQHVNGFRDPLFHSAVAQKRPEPEDSCMKGIHSIRLLPLWPIGALAAKAAANAQMRSDIPPQVV